MLYFQRLPYQQCFLVLFVPVLKFSLEEPVATEGILQPRAGSLQVFPGISALPGGHCSAVRSHLAGLKPAHFMCLNGGDV